MKKDDTMYGMDGQEYLDVTVQEVVERVFENFPLGETRDQVAEKVEWPIRVLAFKRKPLPDAKHIAAWFLEECVERLDENYGPIDEGTDKTAAMEAAALAFAEVMRKEYVSWQCEATGDVTDVTKDEAFGMVAE